MRSPVPFCPPPFEEKLPPFEEKLLAAHCRRSFLPDTIRQVYGDLGPIRDLFDILDANPRSLSKPGNSTNEKT